MTVHILAVDDSRTIRNLLDITLSDAGYLVTLAQDGQDALDRLADLTPDAIISDINMPVMDGLALVEAVRSQPRFRTTPILMLTTETAPDLIARARAAGATGWIVKPFEADKLVRAVQMIAG